jgi:hypothetical protein
LAEFERELIPRTGEGRRRAKAKSPGRRAVGASVGLFALLIALLLGSSADHHDWES